MIQERVPVVKWISYMASDHALWVRILPGTPSGHGLVAEHLPSKQEMGVRFSLPAQTVKNDRAI